MSKYLVLIEKFLNRELSEEERQMLREWVNTSDENLLLFKNSIRKHNFMSKHKFDEKLAYTKFKKVIKAKRREKKKRRQKQFYRYAAVIALCIGVGTLLYYMPQLGKEEVHTSITEAPVALEKDEITIKLANGEEQTISLQAASIYDEHGKVIASKDGEALVFGSDTNTTPTEEALQYHEIYVPHGKTLKIRLSDETIVWLNAGTTFTFPQHFIASVGKREVFLEGEAFFEVTKNKKAPFIVQVNEIGVEVLGTQFNVSSYDTDKAIATTLVEGAVQLFTKENPEAAVALTPNFQATYDKEKDQFKSVKVNTADYTGWRFKRLNINGMKFSEVLKKLERMYDVTFDNQRGDLSAERYAGEFQAESLESILKTISLSTPFRYTIQGNKVIISQ